jgi:hypothetical protein
MAQVHHRYAFCSISPFLTAYCKFILYSECALRGFAVSRQSIFKTLAEVAIRRPYPYSSNALVKHVWRGNNLAAVCFLIVRSLFWIHKASGSGGDLNAQEITMTTHISTFDTGQSVSRSGHCRVIHTHTLCGMILQCSEEILFLHAQDVRYRYILN